MRKYFFTKMTICLVVLLGMVHPISKAQTVIYDDCGTADADDSPTKSASIFEEALNYIPYGTTGDYGLNDQPNKIIDIAFHIFQANDGHGNYQNTTSDIEELKNVLDYLNANYSSGEPTDPVPGCVQLPDYDVKIQFSLGSPGSERIYFYQDDNCYNSASTSTLRNYVSDSFPQNYMSNYDVYFTEGYDYVQVTKIEVTNGGSGYTSAPTVVFTPAIADHSAVSYVSGGKVDSVLITNNKAHSNTWGADNPLPEITLVGGGGSGATVNTTVKVGATGWASELYAYTVLCRMKSNRWSGSVASLLGHEIGHSLSLPHVHTSGICSNSRYIGDIFGAEGCPHKSSWVIAANVSPNDGYCNNMMNYGPSLPYISPVQGGYMHKATSTYKIKDYVREIKHTQPLIVSEEIDVSTEIKLYRDIEIITSGYLKINDETRLPANVIITVNSGGTLEISSDGSLKNHDGTSFTGEIIIKSGGRLYLTNESNLSIGDGGIINFDDGGLVQCYGTGKISGKGKLILNNSFSAIPLSSLTLEGTSTNNLLIEVNGTTTFSEYFNNITLRNCQITMNNSSAELYMYSGIDAVTIDNIKMESNSGSRNNHKGIDIRCDNFSIRNSTFEDGYYGAYLSRSSSAAAKSISNCTFNNNYYGLYTSGGVYNISACTLTGNSYNVYIAGYGGTTNIG